MMESLLERQDVVAAVAGCLERGRGGRGGALFVVGAAGLGKTSILDAAVKLAGTDFEIGIGRGDRMDTAVPFGLFAQAFGDRAGGSFDFLSNPDPGFPTLEPSVPYLRTLRRLRSRIGPPLLLIFDDLHCADADSLNLIGFLTRRTASLSITIIGALRSWPPDALRIVRGLVGGAHAELAQLNPLTRGAAGMLLERHVGTRAGPEEVERALQLCAGNPLLIEQLGEVIGRGDSVPPSGDRGEMPTGRLVLARFAGLDEASMRVARCAAAIGDRFRIEIALAAAELDPDAEERTLEALTRSGLIIEADRGLMRFAHPLFRQTLYEDLPAPVRRRLHGRTFRLFAARGLDDSAADQAIKADLVGDEEAAAVLERVGRAALATGAIATGVVNLSAAVRFRGSRCEPHLLRAFLDSLLASARVEDADAVGRRLLAVTGLKWRDRVETLRTLGHASYLRGSADLGAEQMSSAIELAVRHDPAAAVRPLLDHASIAWMAEGPAAALPQAAKARELARDSELRLRDVTDAFWGHLAAECGDPGALGASAAVGRRLDSGTPGELLEPARLTWPAAAIYGYAHCEKYAERFDRSLRALSLARDALERAGAANGVATATLFIATQLVRQGYPRPALEEAARAEEFSELTPVALPFASLIRAEALLLLGRFGESESQRRIALSSASDPALWLIRLWSSLVLGIRLYRQGDGRSSDEFLEVEHLADSVGLSEPSSQPWAGYAVQAHLAAGRRPDALRVTEMLERRSAGHPSRWPRAIAALSRARILASDGKTEAAEPGFLTAIDLLRPIDLPLERAEALIAWGRFNRVRGRTVAARAPLAEAITLADAAGQSGIASTAHAELKLAGGRRRRTSQDRDLITPAEMRVAREAAGGHTNAEIAGRLHISTNTVRSHLKRVYSKLGIRSRRDLTGMDLDAHARDRQE